MSLSADNVGFCNTNFNLFIFQPSTILLIFSVSFISNIKAQNLENLSNVIQTINRTTRSFPGAFPTPLFGTTTGQVCTADFPGLDSLAQQSQILSRWESRVVCFTRIKIESYRFESALALRASLTLLNSMAQFQICTVKLETLCLHHQHVRSECPSSRLLIAKINCRSIINFQ